MSFIFMDEALIQGGKAPGSCPELEIKPVMPPPALPDLSDQWNFTRECFNSSATNPIRALECTPPLQARVEQRRQKSRPLGAHSNQTSRECPQLSRGNLNFAASLQVPSRGLQFPGSLWVFTLGLAGSAGHCWSWAAGGPGRRLRWLWEGRAPRRASLLQTPVPRCPPGGGLYSLLTPAALGHGYVVCQLINLGKVILTGELHSDWLSYTISIWLSHQAQHKSDLFDVIHDLSPEGSSRILDNSKQHLSKSSCSTAGPIAMSCFFSVSQHIRHTHTHSSGRFIRAFLAPQAHDHKIGTFSSKRELILPESLWGNHWSASFFLSFETTSTAWATFFVNDNKNITLLWKGRMVMKHTAISLKLEEVNTITGLKILKKILSRQKNKIVLH